MKYQGKVRDTILKEVSAMDLAFFAMDPKGTAVSEGYNFAGNKASNAVSKATTSFMGGVKARDMEIARRRRLRMRQSASAVGRAALLEGSREKKKLRGVQEYSGTVPGEAPKTYKPGEAPLANKGADGKAPKPVDPNARFGGAGAATTKSGGSSTLVQPTAKSPDRMAQKQKNNASKKEFLKRKVNTGTTEFNAAGLDKVMQTGDVGSIKDALHSKDKSTRKMTQRAYAKIAPGLVDKAGEVGDSIDPRVGKMARTAARGATGLHKQGQFSDLSKANVHMDKTDEAGNKIGTEVKKLGSVEQKKYDPTAAPKLDTYTKGGRTAAGMNAANYFHRGRDEMNKTTKLRDKMKGNANYVPGNFAQTKANFAKNKEMSPFRHKMGKAGMVGVGVLGATWAAANAFRAGAQAHREQLSQINMLTSDQDLSIGARLLENYQTWKTRKRVYGKSGRRSKGWKFDPLNKNHRKLALKMTDNQFKEISGSKADMGKKTHVKTISGVPLKFTFFSNDRKHNYAGRTIGMRQKTISLHRRLEKSLPHGYENYPFEKVGNYFKRINKTAWHDHHMGKLPLIKRLKIRGNDLLNKVRKLVTHGKVSESTISETMDFVESQPPVVDPDCNFLAEKVSTPMECGCQDCKAISKKIVEKQKELRETSVSSFGQNLRDGTSHEEHEAKETKKREEFERRHKKHKKRKKREDKREMDFLMQGYRDEKSGVIQRVAKMFYRPSRKGD